MADDQFPTPEVAIERIVGIVKSMREKGSTVEEQKSAIKAKLLDVKFVRQQSRTEVLSNVNHKLGTKYSMSQIKAAKSVVLDEPVEEAPKAVTDQPPVNPIPVAELHGSATVDMAASQEHPSGHKFKMTDLPGDKGVVVKVIPDGQMPEDDGGVNADIVVGGRRGADTEQSREESLGGAAIMMHDALHWKRQTLEEIVLKRQRDKIIPTLSLGEELLGYELGDTFIKHAVKDIKGDIIEIVMDAEDQVISRTNLSQQIRDQQAEQAAQQTNQTQTQNTEEDTMTNANATHKAAHEQFAAKDLGEFIVFQSSLGLNTESLRLQAFMNFLGAHPEVQTRWGAFTQAQPAEVSNDKRIYDFLDVEKDFAMLYMLNMVSGGVDVNALNNAEAEAKSRFTLMNDRDEGVRSSWIGVGGAVVGGGMEMMARGGLTLGSGIGAIAGAVGAFFAGELIDNNIENQFGRYVAAGTVGLALGAGGSALGRTLLPGNNLLAAGSAPTALDVDPSVTAGLIAL